MKAIIGNRNIEIDYGSKTTKLLVEIDGETHVLFEGKEAQLAIEILVNFVGQNPKEKRYVVGGNRINHRFINLTGLADKVIQYFGISPYIFAPKLFRELLQA